MEGNFEIWKQKLEEDSEYAVPDFNKEQVWSKIHPRIKERKAIGWWRYAAAILLCLCIGGAALKLWPTHQPSVGETPVATVIKPSVTIPAPVTKPTPVNTQPSVIMHKRVIKTNAVATATPHKTIPAIVTPALPPIITPPMQQTTEPQPVAAAKPSIKTPLPVIHLLDIKNEDVREVVNNTAPQYSKHLISPKRLPVNENNLPSTIVSNYIRN